MSEFNPTERVRTRSTPDLPVYLQGKTGRIVRPASVAGHYVELDEPVGGQTQYKFGERQLQKISNIG